MHKFRSARELVNLRQGRNDWYRIHNVADGFAEVMIYDEIGYFGITANDFVKELAGLQADRLNVHLNTPGGEVFDGIAIYNALKSHPAEVHVTVDSLAASIGSVIAMAGDRIVMARNSTMMIHDGMGIAIGNAADMRELADLLDKTSDNIASIYAERSGKPADHWRGLMRAEQWYSAEEAVGAGLADEVAAPRGKAQENSWDLSIYSNYRPQPTEELPAESPKQPVFKLTPESFKAALKEAFDD